MELGLVFCPYSMKEKSLRIHMSSPAWQAGVGKDGVGGRIYLHGNPLTIEIPLKPPFEMLQNFRCHTDLVTQRKFLWFHWLCSDICNGRRCNRPSITKSAAAFSCPKWDRKSLADTEVFCKNILTESNIFICLVWGTLTILIWVRNSIPMKVNTWAGTRSDFS